MDADRGLPPDDAARRRARSRRRSRRPRRSAASSRRESRRTRGTISGPGATASPACSADQPQSSWSQSTIESSIAPNAVEKSDVASAGERERALAQQRELEDRAACERSARGRRRGAPRRRRARRPTRAELQPQSWRLDEAERERADRPRRAARRRRAVGSGRRAPRPRGSTRRPATIAAMPIGTLTRNTQRQLACTSSPPSSGAGRGREPPIAAHTRTAPGRRSAGYAASTSPSDVGTSSAAPTACTIRNATSMPTDGRGGARRRGGREDRDADEEAAALRPCGRRAARRDEERGEHDGVGVQHPREVRRGVAPGSPARISGQRDVDDEEVEARQHDAGADDGHDDAGARCASHGLSPLRHETRA